MNGFLNYFGAGIDREDLPSIVDTARPLLNLAEGLPYFKDNFFEKRLLKFALRGGLILVILLGAFIPALIGDVLWIDDTEATHELLLRSAGGLSQLWRHPSIQPAYQPMADTILWLQHDLWKNSALGYHIVGLLLHMANCILVWFALRRLNVAGAWLAAAIFALHPMQAQAVAWVGGQPLMIGTFFYALSLILFLRFAQIEPPQDLDPSVKLSEEWYETHPDQPPVAVTLGAMPKTCYVISLLFFLCAVLSDSGAWSLPVILLMIAWWRGGSVTRKDVKALMPYMVVGGLSLLFNLIQTELYASRAGVATDLGIVGRFLLPGRVLFFYLSSLVVPFPLTFAGPQWHVSAMVWWQYLFLIAFIAGLGCIWHWRERIGKGPLIAIAFFLLTLLPVLGLVRFGWMRYSFVGDYLQYRACIAPIAVTVGGLMFLFKRAKSKHIEHFLRILCGLAILVPFSALFLMQSLNYASAESLWSNDVDFDPHSEVARIRLAADYLQQGKPDDAIKQIRDGIKTDGKSVRLWVELGKALDADRRWGAAIQAYSTASELDPKNTDALSRLGASQARKGNVQEAIQTYLHVIEIDPNDAKPHEAVALLYNDQKNSDAAIAHLLQAVKIDPNAVSSHLILARIFFEAGRYTESAEQLQIAAKIDPNNYDTFMTAGELLSKLGDFRRAERMYRDACRIRPTAEAFNNLGVALAKQGRFGEAIYAFNQALKIQPDFGPAQKNVQSAKLGEVQEKQAPPPDRTIPEPTRAPTTAPTTRPAIRPTPTTVPARSPTPVVSPNASPAQTPKPATRPAPAIRPSTRNIAGG